MAHQAEAYPGFSSMKRLGIFLLAPGWGMLVHRRVQRRETDDNVTHTDGDHVIHASIISVNFKKTTWVFIRIVKRPREIHFLGLSK